MTKETFSVETLAAATDHMQNTIGTSTFAFMPARLHKAFPNFYEMTLDEIEKGLQDLADLRSSIEGVLTSKLASGYFPFISNAEASALMADGTSAADALTSIHLQHTFHLLTLGQENRRIMTDENRDGMWLRPNRDDLTDFEGDLNLEMIEKVLASADNDAKILLAQLVWDETEELHHNPEISIITAWEIHEDAAMMSREVHASVEASVKSGQIPRLCPTEIIEALGIEHHLKHIRPDDDTQPGVFLLRNVFPLEFKGAYLFLDYHAGLVEQDNPAFEVHTAAHWRPESNDSDSIPTRLHALLEDDKKKRQSQQDALSGSDFLNLLPQGVQDLLDRINTELADRLSKSKLPFVEVPLTEAPCEVTDWVQTPQLIDLYKHPLMLMDIVRLYYRKAYGISAMCTQDDNRGVIAFSF